MELQELVDRIQRWKERTSSQPAPDYAASDTFESASSEPGFAVEAESFESASPEPELAVEAETNDAEPGPMAKNDVLDFEEMDDVTELQGDDSGIVEVMEPDEK